MDKPEAAHSHQLWSKVYNGPPFLVGTDKSFHLQSLQLVEVGTWGRSQSQGLPLGSLAERCEKIISFTDIKVSGSHWGGGNPSPDCQAGILLWAWVFLKEPNSSVKESLVPEPFKTHCFSCSQNMPTEVCVFGNQMEAIFIYFICGQR